MSSYSHAGEEKEKEAKTGRCSVESSHLCRCGGLGVGGGAAVLTIALHNRSLRLLFSVQSAVYSQRWENK